MIDLNKLRQETQVLVKAASKLMLGVFTTEEKGSPDNIVTSADLAVQSFLEQELKALLPGSGFFGEEGSSGCGNGYLWVVDPIDGTTNFSRGIPECGISVALLKDDAPVIGVVYNPYRDSMYSAVKGQGAACNGKTIHVSGKTFREGLFCTALSLYRKEFGQRCLEVLREVYAGCSDFRRMGSCALELCYLAEGKV